MEKIKTKKELKIVLHKYIPPNVKQRKRKYVKDSDGDIGSVEQLCSTLLKQEKKRILNKKSYEEEKIVSPRKQKKTKGILKPQKRKFKSKDESSSGEELRLKLLKKEKKRVFTKKLDDEEKIIFPTITKSHMDSFMHLLKNKDIKTGPQKDLEKCLDKMNSSCNPLWSSPLYMMQAIKDCILNRKWNNLSHILSILVTLPDDRYRPIISHVSFCFYIMNLKITFLFFSFFK